MRDSIEHRVETEGLGMEVAGLVGTDNEIAKYQELGTRTIPPRSFLGEAAMHKEEEIQAIRLCNGLSCSAWAQALICRLIRTKGSSNIIVQLPKR
jgi:hypothetical protein